MARGTLVGLVTVMSLGCASLAGCASQTGRPEPTQDPTVVAGTAAEAFALTDQSDYRVAGSYSLGSSLVVFDSSMTPEGVSTVALTVNGATITLTADLFSFVATEDGGGNTLFGADLAVLGRFERYLEAHGQKGRPWERLFKAVSMYAGAPAGHTMLVKTIAAGPSALRDGSGRPGGTVSTESLIYVCVGASGHHMYDQADWVWAEHDSTTGEGGNGYHWRLEGWEPAGCYISNLTSYTTWYAPGYRDQNNNPYWLGIQNGSWTDGAWYNDSDPASVTGQWTGGGVCEGRCGSGCPRAYNWYWTKDCLDHDICLDYHTNANTTGSGDCGYEYSDAQGDWIWGSSHDYQYSYCGWVPYGCTENGNSQTAGW
jgi:hypothetical protein